MRTASKLGLVSVLIGTWLLMAAGPPAPVRNLTPAEAKEASVLQAKLDEYSEAGQFEQAAATARELATYRQLRQGRRHWEAIDARFEIQQWELLSKVPSSERKQVLLARQCENEGLQLRSKGRSREAVKPLREALDIRVRVLGENHPAVASSCNNLAAVLQGPKQRAEVVALLRRALEIRKTSLGDQHPATAQSYNNLASVLQQDGKQAESLQLHRKALDICLQVLGEDHPDTARSYNNLGFSLNEQGKFAEAEPMCRKALDIRMRTLGDQDASTANSYNNLAFNLNAQHRHAEALPLFHKALNIKLRQHGEQHPDTASSYNNLASCLNAQGKHAEAFPLYRKALDLHLQLLGEDHPATANSYNNVAGCLYDQGRFAEAYLLFRQSLDIHLRQLGEQHPATATAYDNVAGCLGKQGKHTEALRLHRKALEIHSRMFGELHPDTLNSYRSLGICLQQQGKHTEALGVFRKIQALRSRRLDSRASDMSASYNVAFCLNALGNRAEALRLLQADLADHEIARFQTAQSGFDRARATLQYRSPQAILAAGLALAGQPCNAFRHADLALGRALLDDLATQDPAHRQRLNELSTQLQRVESQLVPLLALTSPDASQQQQRSALLARRGRLEADRASLAARQSSEQVLPLSVIQARLPADAALVFWLDVWDMHLGCVVRRDGLPHWVNLSPTGEWQASASSLPSRVDAALQARTLTAAERDGLLARVDEKERAAYREALDPARLDELLAALRKQRLDPLEPHLKGIRQLLVVPAGKMSRVPVEALSDARTVSYISSGSFLARSRQQHRPLALTSALVLADPAYQQAARPLPPVPSHGLVVKSVLPGGLGAKIGLRPGDVLLAYAGKQLVRPEDLTDNSKSDTLVRVQIWRGGKTLSGQVPASKLNVDIDPRSIAEALADWRGEQQGIQRALRGQDWTDLPGTRIEAEFLRKLIPAATFLLRSDASQTNLAQMASSRKLKDYRLLHLAVHGETNPTRPELSALVLAQDRLPPEAVGGGRLTVQEVLRTWELDADLVVLSACQTGLGQYTSSEGMLGFAHALLQRGARSVVLSRWKVDDSATALLMMRFYQNLLGKREGLKAPLPRPQALTEAKHWLRDLSRSDAEKELRTLGASLPRGVGKPLHLPAPTRETREARPFANPYFWAAFVLLGDPE